MTAVSHAQAQSAGVYLGQVVSEEFMRREAAASPASVWQTGLLTALESLGHPLSIYGGTPRSAWPRGRLLASPHRSFHGEGLEAEMQGYINLPVVKLFSQYRRLRRVLSDHIRRSGTPPTVLSYNAGLPEALAARWLQEEHGVPWTCVVADYPDISDTRVPLARRLALSRYSRYQQEWIRQARGRIFLSWALFTGESNGPKLYFEGGIERIRTSSAHRADQGKRVVMYAGGLNALTGVDALLEAFARVRDRDCELWICGRGNLEAEITEAAARDPRIRFHGLVSHDELVDLMSRAHLFINPRPSSVPENRYNFPSKLLEYLSWCRPVISTITPGIAPSYRSLLLSVEDETPEGLATTIEQGLSQSAEQLNATGERIRAYVEENLLWSVQARRLWSWLEDEGLTLSTEG